MANIDKTMLYVFKYQVKNFTFRVHTYKTRLKMGSASKNSTQWRHRNGGAWNILSSSGNIVSPVSYIYSMYIYLYIFEFDNTWVLWVSRGNLFYNTAVLYLKVLYCSTFGTRLLSLLHPRILLVLCERIHSWITLCYTNKNGVNTRLFIYSNMTRSRLANK